MAELMAVSAPSRLWVTGREAQTTRRHLAPSPFVYVICRAPSVSQYIGKLRLRLNINNIINTKIYNN